MDVDLLRPGMIPIAPNTKLWFEFLIEPSLLEEHLNKPNAGINVKLIILINYLHYIHTYNHISIILYTYLVAH